MTLTISRLVAQVESGNNRTLVRYEPNWKYVTARILDLFQKAHAPGRMTQQTAQMLLSCSWGKFQLMGSVLYELGYSGALVDFASNETLQEVYFDMYIKARGINFTLAEIVNDPAKREKFALKYNGDKIVYAQRLLTVYHSMKGN